MLDELVETDIYICNFIETLEHSRRVIFPFVNMEFLHNFDLVQIVIDLPI